MSTSNTFGWRTVLVVFLTVLLLSTATSAQDSYPERKLIAIQSNSDEFRQIVDAIRDPSRKMIPDTDLKPSDIYVRLTERRFVLKDDEFTDEAYLGGKPYVFLTVPQASYGRSLYEIYSDLGYDAEGILKQRNKTMVALVLRYKADIKFSPERFGNGPLDKENFRKYVYVPTWENGFALFARLAGETVPPNSKDSVLYTSFGDDANRHRTVLSSGKKGAHCSVTLSGASHGRRT